MLHPYQSRPRQRSQLLKYAAVFVPCSDRVVGTETLHVVHLHAADFDGMHSKTLMQSVAALFVGPLLYVQRLQLMQACIVAVPVQSSTCLLQSHEQMLVAAVSQCQKQVDHCCSVTTSGACCCTGISLVALVAWRDCALCCRPHRQMHRHTCQHLNRLKPPPSFLRHRNAYSSIGS